MSGADFTVAIAALLVIVAVPSVFLLWVARRRR